MAAKPLLSVIIPAYNYAHYLREAVESVLNQPFDPLEVIIVDDASTDATPQVAQTLAHRDPRVRYVRNPQNLGVAETQNRGLGLAQGTYCAFLGADDFWLPRRLPGVLEPLERDPRVGLVHTAAWVVDSLGRRITRRIRTAPCRRPCVYEPLPDLLRRNRVLAVSAVFRKVALVRRPEETGPPPDPFPPVVPPCLPHAADWQTWLLIALGGWRFAYLPSPTVAYRLHRQSHHVRVAEGGRILEEYERLLAWAFSRYTLSEKEKQAVYADVFLYAAHQYIAAGNLPAFKEAVEKALAHDPRALGRNPLTGLLLLLSFLPPRLFPLLYHAALRTLGYL